MGLKATNKESDMRGFSEKERELLVQMARKSKVEGYSLTKVFDEYAVKTKRASGSVRNFYYSLLKENGKITEGLHASAIKPFDKCETVKLVAEILKRASGGKSVRKVISQMADNEKEALRIQNKYRNVVKNERQLVEGVMQGLERAGQAYKNPYEKPVLKRGYAYHRLQREINGLFEKIAQKEKKINEQLREKIKTLEEENEQLKQNFSPIVSFYNEPHADDKAEN